MSANLDTRFLLDAAQAPDIYTRVKLTMELCEFLDDPATSFVERQAVLPVLLKLSEDCSSVVRRTLLSRVRHSRNAPEEVALALAGDEEDIACDILEHFPGFDENVLVGIAKIADAPRLAAIARRSPLGARICLALLEHGDTTVCRAVLSNATAEINKSGYEAIERRFGGLKKFEKLLVKRRDVPALVAVKMVEDVSARLYKHARAKNWVMPEKMARVVAEAREQGIAKIIARTDLGADASVVDGLLAQRIVTPSLILRSACIGKLDFVEEIFCRLTKMPPTMVHSMMFARGAMGFKALYSKSGLPGRFYAPMRVAVDVHRELSKAQGDWDQAMFGRHMIERILTQYEEFSDADKRQLLATLKSVAGEETRPLVDQVLDGLSLAA